MSAKSGRSWQRATQALPIDESRRPVRIDPSGSPTPRDSRSLCDPLGSERFVKNEPSGDKEKWEQVRGGMPAPIGSVKDRKPENTQLLVGKPTKIQTRQLIATAGKPIDRRGSNAEAQKLAAQKL